eukprot:356543-Chlamydomonas_euryale.AAC.13
MTLSRAASVTHTLTGLQMVGSGRRGSKGKSKAQQGPTKSDAKPWSELELGGQTDAAEGPKKTAGTRDDTYASPTHTTTIATTIATHTHTTSIHTPAPPPPASPPHKA